MLRSVKTALARWLIVIGVVVLGGAKTAFAQAPEQDAREHHIVYELGWASDWSHDEGFRANGGTFAIEVTPLEHWLEIEAGVTAIHSQDTELSADLLFKKPWTISEQVELMAGVGPGVIRDSGQRATHWGLSAVLDLMVWPKPHVGWYVEPGYEAVFRVGTTQHGLAVAAGLLLGR